MPQLEDLSMNSCCLVHSGLSSLKKFASCLTLTLGEVDLTAHIWPSQLDRLALGFADMDSFFEDDAQSLECYTGEVNGRLQLYGISERPLKYIRLSGGGNVELKGIPDGKYQCIITVYDQYDSFKYDDPIDEKSITPEAINQYKFLVNGQWKFFNY
ncbi:unnamed protein product [Ambrosiozyma monospora]|uniref:Unnamed protein product n=1 Tax=Ambrosiozyma monospora TaxID=43982 RepID=A0ACB5U9C5_AMBMO|nr:unnamed protein product [Ambrosiozyma monospora]